MTKEKFTHGRFKVEPVWNDNGVARFNIFASNGDASYVILNNEGAELGVHGEEQTITFGGPTDFDELRDLITFLHGKVRETAK